MISKQPLYIKKKQNKYFEKKMKFIATVFVCIVTVPFIVFESLRFYTHHNECQVAHAQNDLLLNNPLCSDPWQMYTHGPKQEAVCAKAMAENQVSVLSCAWQHMWLRGEVHRIFIMITESYWMLLGFIVPCMLALIYLWFWSSNERASRKDLMDLQREMYRETLQHIHGQQIQSLTTTAPRFLEDEFNYGGGARRKKHNYVQLISQDE